MSNKETLIFYTISILFLLVIASKINAKIENGDETLLYSYGSKLLRNSESIIDMREFKESDYLHQVKIESQGLKENDLIERLPGQPINVRLKQYGGYVTVDRAAGRAFYYYFVEGKRAQELPLLLWLNGGPGCSSIGNGAMTENGPFWVRSDGKTLYYNKFAWNNAANVLFLESPAGVGFSYSNTTADVETGGDRQTNIDNYTFLLNWLERFPEYKDRDFYISGESYAGHYGTLLAQTILKNNRKANKTLVNLKGIIIGNPSLDREADERGQYEYLGSHALISNETTHQILKHCDFPLMLSKSSDKCIKAVEEAHMNLHGIYVYNIYTPLCLNSNLTEKPKKISQLNLDPCIDNYVHAYLNRAEVQEALHANVTKLPYEWQGCSPVIKRWIDGPANVTPLLKDFLANSLRVWIFSGDVDGRVPVTSTRLCLQKMNLHPKSSYLHWYSGEQIAGYTQLYKDNLRFATIRGAGHQVPRYQPARALTLIMHFLAGNDLPTSNN